MLKRILSAVAGACVFMMLFSVADASCEVKSNAQSSFKKVTDGTKSKSEVIMNDTLKVLEARRSCRNFKPDMVKDSELQAIIKAGTYAPTGMNRQSPIIIAVTDKKLRDRLSEVNRSFGPWKEGFDPFYGAPVILIVLADKSVPTYVYDGSLVMGNMMNAAASMGVGSIWIHRAKEEFESEFGKELLKELGIEGDYEGIGHCAIGYPAVPDKDPAPRKEGYVYFVK